MAAEKYISWSGTTNVLKTFADVNEGVATAGKPICANDLGEIDPSFLPGSGIESIMAAEDITAGSAIHIIDDAGTRKMELADAKTNKPCNAFAVEDTLTNSIGRIDKDGSVTVIGVAISEQYYLGENGAVVYTPTIDSGDIIQLVGTGTDVDVLEIERGIITIVE